MKATHTLYRCSRRQRGAILIFVLILSAFTALLASSNLERARQRIILDSALAERAQVDEVLTHTLYQGIAYARDRLNIEDFDRAVHGVYRTVDTQRMQGDYRRFSRPLPISALGVDSGFWIELFATDAIIQEMHGAFYSNCRLLVSAYAETSNQAASFSQALVAMALPTTTVPTTDTKVVQVESVATAKVIATRIID